MRELSPNCENDLSDPPASAIVSDRRGLCRAAALRLAGAGLRGELNPREERMQTSEEKVIPLKTEGEGQSGSEAKASAPARTRDAGRAALFISVLAVILLAIFFYSLNRNLAGVVEEVRSLGALKSQMTEVTTRTLALEGKVAVIEAAPEMARKAVLRMMLDEMAKKLEMLAAESVGDAQRDKIEQARELLQQARIQMPE